MLRTWLPRLASLCAALALTGCANVKVLTVDAKSYIAQRRGDVLSAGSLSAAGADSLRTLGLDPARCSSDPAVCREGLQTSDGLSDEQRLSALAELWMQSAILLENSAPGGPDTAAALNANLEAARHAYAYLFFTARQPSERAFEDRQTQVRDYYNFAVKQAISQLFPRHRERSSRPDSVITEGDWRIQLRFEDGRPPGEHRLPQALVPASSVDFDAVRNTYRRDGFGADVVAVAPLDDQQAPFTPMQYPAYSGIARFGGRNLAEVLATRELELVGYDPFLHSAVELAGSRVPLAANFTAGYGLWLAGSGFTTQAIYTVLGRDQGVKAPHVYLMQPYDPKRRVVLMLHGLASSPEAWINVANEVLGDEGLRQRYQVWQVYYPTNAPIAYNHLEVRKAVEQTLAHFDPTGRAAASRDMVLIGHSMGGVLARLMASSSGSELEPAFLAQYGLDQSALGPVRDKAGVYLNFTPMPQVGRAIFIAAPHRGTPVAQSRAARWVANLVRLPVAVVDSLSDLNLTLASRGAGASPLHLPNSIENLSDQSLFLRLADSMPISAGVRTHSIIAREKPTQTLRESSDGVVPYVSSHLDGAVSELVITSGHSVQETPQAILEIRRILRLP